MAKLSTILLQQEPNSSPWITTVMWQWQRLVQWLRKAAIPDLELARGASIPFGW